jgi:endonuclease YncB( thermonuclease family)
MRINSILIAIVIPFTLGVATPENEPPKSDVPSKVVPEKARSSNGTWTKLTGKARVVNAYTLRFEDGMEVDLRFTADAPEPEQKGLFGDKLYPCGKEAAEFLAKLIRGETVTLFVDGDVVPGRTPRGPCYVGEKQLQLEMVRSGWMVSAHSAMDTWEIIARENRRGLWRGEFIPPKRWRKGERLPGEEAPSP